MRCVCAGCKVDLLQVVPPFASWSTISLLGDFDMCFDSLLCYVMFGS